MDDWENIEDPCHWCGGYGEDRRTGKPCGDCMGSGKNIWRFEDCDWLDGNSYCIICYDDLCDCWKEKK